MSSSEHDELRPEYPPELIRSGERGKYAARYRAGTNLVPIDPDLHEHYPDTEAVNRALREHRVEELERAVSELPPEDLRRFREWFAVFDSAVWDRQLESDSTQGRLDDLVQGALAEHRSGQSRPL